MAFPTVTGTGCLFLLTSVPATNFLTVPSTALNVSSAFFTTCAGPDFAGAAFVEAGFVTAVAAGFVAAGFATAGADAVVTGFAAAGCAGFAAGATGDVIFACATTVVGAVPFCALYAATA